MFTSDKSASLPSCVVRGRVIASDLALRTRHQLPGVDPHSEIEFEGGQVFELKDSGARNIEVPLLKVDDRVLLCGSEFEPGKFMFPSRLAIDWNNRKTFVRNGRRTVNYKESGMIIRKANVVETKLDGSRQIMTHFAVELVDADGKRHTVSFRCAATDFAGLVMADIGCCVDLTYSPNYAADASVTVKKFRVDWQKTTNARVYIKRFARNRADYLR